MKSIILHAWTLHEKDGGYYLPYTHWIYLNEIKKYYTRICLLSPVKSYDDNETIQGMVHLADLGEDFFVYKLPYSQGYIDSIKYFFSYRKAYAKLHDFSSIYIRYPIPFGWLSRLYHRKIKRIIHFVGDPIDTIKVNPNISNIKKNMLIMGFKPEHLLYMWACKNANVYTNGFHIASRLTKYKVEATPLISSTLNKDDFFYDETKTIDKNVPKILYVGYLRKAKGCDTVLNSFALLQEKYKGAKLSIVGDGESAHELKGIVQERNLKNISFLGHIDNRKILNDILRTHDIFCFASLSEGSPRVILEAMANGLNIVSTPVGALPSMFENGKDIIYADFHNADQFFKEMSNLIEDEQNAEVLRKTAFEKVRSYTIANFLKNIFDET